MEDLADRVYQMTQLTRDLLRASTASRQMRLLIPGRLPTKTTFLCVVLQRQRSGCQEVAGSPPAVGLISAAREAKRAYGRQSRAQSPLAQVIADLTGKIIRNRKNEVSKAFLQMVENNPDPSQWQVLMDANPDPAALRGPNADKRTAPDGDGAR